MATQVTWIGNGTPVHWNDASVESVLYPAGAQKGDLVLLHVRATANVTETWSPGASGFRRRAQHSQLDYVYTRLMDGTEPINFFVQFSGTSGKSARTYLFRGPRGDTFVDVQVRTGTGTTISHDDVRAHASGRFALALVSYGSTAGAPTFGGETGGDWIERAEASSGAGGNRTIQLQTAQMTAGTLSGGAMTPGGSLGTWIVHTFALAPSASAQSVHARVSVADPDDVMRDMRTLAGKDWQVSVSYEHDIDAPVSSATVTLFRSDNPTLSLAPLITASTLNRDAGSQYAPFLHASRRITIEAATIESAVSEPFADEWRLVFDGYIDRVDSGGELMVVVQCRDQGAVLQTEWVQEVTTYGDDGGSKTAHAVIQDILNDWITDPPTLFVPTAPVPPVLIHEYQQQKMSVMDAIKAVATGHGWDVRYLFDEGTGQWRLTYYEPQRDTNEISGAFTASDYTLVNSLAIGVADIRNDISVIFTNESGEPDQVTVEDTVSIAKWGGLHRFAEFEFGTDSPIDTASEANALLAAALSDLSDPFAEQEVTFPFNPDVNIGRLYEFLGNDEQYDETQRFAPSRVVHEIGAEGATTTAQMRGRIAGQFKAWLRNERGTGPPKDGVDGLTTEFRFRCSTTQPLTPAGNDPPGWFLQPPVCSLPSVLWQSSAQRNSRTGEVVGVWTTPVRVTGPDGAEGPQGAPGEDGTAGPRITFFRAFPGVVTADALIRLDHSESDGGTLEVWVNPAGVTSPNREAAADGSVAVGSTPFIADDGTVFSGGQLLDNIPVAFAVPKTIYARFTDTQGRVADGQAVIPGQIQVDDPFGILTPLDPGGVVERWALRLVTNPMVSERAISFRNLVIGSYDNLISDPSFEAAGAFEAGGATATAALTQAGWSQITGAGGTWSTTTANPAAGTYACVYSRSGQTATAFLRQEFSGAGAIAAAEGDKHYFQARARMSGAGSGGQAFVQIVYRDAAGGSLGSTASVNVNLTFTYQTIALEAPPAPAGTAYVTFQLAVVNTGTIANILWDDCFARLMVGGTLIVDGAILAKHLSAGSVTTVALAAKAARIQNLSIGSLGNMIPDPIFTSGAFVDPGDLGTSTSLTQSEWTITSSGGGTWSLSSSLAKVGGFSLNYTRTGQTGTGVIRHVLESMEATEGDEFYHRCYVRGTGAGSGSSAGVAIRFRDAPAPAGATLGTFTDVTPAAVGVYSLRDVTGVAPAGTTHVDFELRVTNNGTTEAIRFDDVYAQHMVGGTLIVDGSIEARHISTLTMEIGQFIRSADYVAGVSGWNIGFDGSDDGFAEFSNVIVRGDLAAGSTISADDIQIGGALTIDTTTGGLILLNAGSNQFQIQSESTSDLNILATGTGAQINLDADAGVLIDFPVIGPRTLVLDGINTAGGGFRNVRVAN